MRAVASVLGALPADFPAALCVALHRAQAGHVPEGLTQFIAPRTALTVHTAQDERSIEPGHVYVCPADYHMVLQNGLLRLEQSPVEQRFRPCIDVLFKSAASTYGRRVVGVLLTGAYGNDGSPGLWHIKRRGGVTIVQDPRDAQFAAMPQSAIDSVAVDYVLPLQDIGSRLVQLTTRSPTAVANEASTRILIVEDESVVATNLQQGLSEMGYHVIDWVPSGEAAIELAEREHPDVVLMDIHLAGTLTGIDAARRIWQTSQIPIVYCTALADVETLKAVQTTESYGYVVKPFQSGAVRAAIELALARREKELR
jgi:chemotaxis response regulator CheB